MDLHLRGAEATEAEQEALGVVLGPEAPHDEGLRAVWGGASDRRRRHLLLPALQALQARVGWITPGGLELVCRRLDVAPADAYGVASFYALLSLRPGPRRVVHVCQDGACRLAGSPQLLDGAPAATDAAAHASPCLGLCELAPAALLIEAGERPLAEPVAPVDSAILAGLLAGTRSAMASRERTAAGAPPQAGDGELVLLRRVGVVDPTSLDDYRAHGGYEALRRAIELGPAGVLRELADARLVGRGGAAFPTARKWEAVARNPARPHHVVCNADESEPGTFKDRVLLEGDPFAVLEAMTVAALATGCENGWIYLRGEYPVAHRRLTAAVDRARRRGYLGDDVLGSGLRFDLEIRRGAGAYVCGEETALFASLEGYRGEPRTKPPFPTDAGLFGRPTLVNNVETLVNLLPIVLEGGPAFAAVGTEASTGTKLFCLSGAVRRPGVYEVPFGTTLGALLDLAGGLPAGRSLRAVLLGGAAGTFLGPDLLDLPLTFEAARAAGATLGSGAVLVLDDTADLPDLLVRIAGFFRDESCGQCVPCRVGTLRQEEALVRLAAGTSRDRSLDLRLLDEVGRAMDDASICGLGQTASAAVRSALGRLDPFGGAP